ncbi:MAG: alcohol dehydrogenase catalytic domain-containing protein [Planctomycetes bacterium]|jgi:threonine dehydrogenase-like Zn-dependent dehydrogenase|nr:alcohol dehydrogenase catalytic domain-containing protein [Phycisphaerae bacterium]NBB94113.1 alcohol dehydrogenase catalytic domain-containing protein [Planctomycetota bacterium]
MKAICFDGDEATFRDDLPQPKPAGGEVLIRMRAAGVCRTDLEILRGYMGFAGVMGHEFVGEVVDGPSGLACRRVVGEINCLAKSPHPAFRRGRGVRNPSPFGGGGESASRWGSGGHCRRLLTRPLARAEQ